MPHPTQSSSSGSATARALAVLALLTALVASTAVITGSLGSDSGDGRSRDHSRASQPKHPTEKYYVIQAGDTFDAIAAKAGIDPTKLAQLNPDLDTQQLPITGCVNLVPEGCKILTQGG
jgi:LysM repeat protein